MFRMIYAILFCLAGLLIQQPATAQEDYVITWNNDTLPVRLPERPGKEGLRPASKYLNGYMRLAVFFNPDSVRILDAGRIKGYYRKEHGQSLLCNGHFESLKAPGWKNRSEGVWTEAEPPWFFMNRVVEGKYATLYSIYENNGKSPNLYFFLKKKGGAERETHNFYGKEQRMNLLMDEDIYEEMKRVFATRLRRKPVELVKEYNRLKELASIKNQGTN